MKTLRKKSFGIHIGHVVGRNPLGHTHGMQSLFLIGTVSRFPYGSRQVCLYFYYARVEEGSEIRIIWSLEDKVVQAETYPLPAPSGSRMYCLLQESGIPLPKGNYTIGIVYRSEAMPKFHFEIY